MRNPLGVDIRPQRITGAWDDGYSLDRHTISSTMTGYNAFGHPEFDTKRSPLGELIYRLKYKSDLNVIGTIVETVAEFMDDWDVHPQLLIPVPPSNTARRNQPVIEIARRLSNSIGLELCEDCVRKVKTTTQLKDGVDFSEKMGALAGAFAISSQKVAGKAILIFDDLYDSGATMNTIVAGLKRARACTTYALTLTRTRGQ